MCSGQRTVAVLFPGSIGKAIAHNTSGSRPRRGIPPLPDGWFHIQDRICAAGAACMAMERPTFVLLYLLYLGL